MIKLTLEDLIKHILDKIENDEELRKLAILIDTHPEYKDQILKAWANDITAEAKLRYNAPPHIGCKQTPAELSMADYFLEYINQFIEELEGE